MVRPHILVVALCHIDPKRMTFLRFQWFYSTTKHRICSRPTRPTWGASSFTWGGQRPRCASVPNIIPMWVRRGLRGPWCCCITQKCLRYLVEYNIWWQRAGQMAPLDPYGPTWVWYWEHLHSAVADPPHVKDDAPHVGRCREHIRCLVIDPKGFLDRILLYWHNTVEQNN